MKPNKRRDHPTKVRAPKVVAEVRQAPGGIWDDESKSYKFAEGQYIDTDGGYVDVSGLEVPLNKSHRYGASEIRLLLEKIRPEIDGIEVIPSYFYPDNSNQAYNEANAELIRSEIDAIMARRKASASAEQENVVVLSEAQKLPKKIEAASNGTTILMPLLSEEIDHHNNNQIITHWSLLALRFNEDFTVCEPFSVTTFGENVYSAEKLNRHLARILPEETEIDESIDIVTMQQNSATYRTEDCGLYLVQNAENIASLGLGEATFSIDKTQQEVGQSIEGDNVGLRGISVRARHASILALNTRVVEGVESLVTTGMVGGEGAAANLAVEIQNRIELKREADAAVVVEAPRVVDSEGQIEVSGSGVVATVAQRDVVEIFQTKLSEVAAAEGGIFFHLGSLGNSTEELKVRTDKGEVVVEREEGTRSRPIITQHLISLSAAETSKKAKSQHRAEFGGVVFDETSVEKDAGKNQEAGIFNNADLQSANFRGCKFDNVDFSSIDPKVLSTFSFTNCEFKDCNFPEGFKFQQYQFKFKQTDKFGLDELTELRGDKKIPKGIPADKFEDEPAPKPEAASAEQLRLAIMVR